MDTKNLRPHNFITKIPDYDSYRTVSKYMAVTQDKTDENVNCMGKCSFVQLFWLFLIGAFLGDIVETIFCHATTGVWTSRSSLVWGHFSVVWGLAAALITSLLYKDKDKHDYHVFWKGVFLGGAYEYICSIFTEIVFGKVFWDYSDIAFNLGGRINLLFCFFWGIVAVVWIKRVYPKVSCFIDIILRKTGRILTLGFIIFITLDIFVSVLALVRYDTRTNGKEAEYKWEQTIDKYFDNMDGTNLPLMQYNSKHYIKHIKNKKQKNMALKKQSITFNYT